MVARLHHATSDATVPGQQTVCTRCTRLSPLWLEYPAGRMPVISPFLEMPRSAWVAENALAFALRDGSPVSPGHTLVVPKRLVATWFEATRDEQLAILELMDEVKRQLDGSSPKPDGYNVGFNAGTAAGQTVMHLHVHVIPRYRGDMDDPRGGVRHVIPSKGNYLRAVPPLASGGEKDPFAHHLLPLIARANHIAIVAAFVQESGLRRVGEALRRSVERGAHIQILTGDYLEITQVSALELLLDWQSSASLGDDESEAPTGTIAVRVVETEKLPGRSRSFHPKSWRFESPSFGAAFVGSSNLSRAALDTAIEWNLRVDRDRDAYAFESVRAAFAELWSLGTPLTAAFIETYAKRVHARPRGLPPGEIEKDILEPFPEPHIVQREALAKLSEARTEGRRRALVVLATGLGKTNLAALDHAALGTEMGAPARLLFLAHRRELLLQAAHTFRRYAHQHQQPARVGWFVGDGGTLDGDLVFASVAKLARPENIERLRNQRFDYVVVDEVHHASADSYRRILGVLEPGFLLGLTATPDRADAGDVLGLFDDFLAYRAGIDRGIDIERLVPFHYFGVRDEIDYENIPWRNRRFEPEALASAAQTEARMESMWRAWEAHPGSCSIVFCCSIAHAIFTRNWLRKRGVRAVAVYAGEGSDDRDEALTQLKDGAIDALCAVDVFNEGVDLPSVDRVVMLRPTESSVVFLQQLGRGLRVAEGKEALTVIDFVGNHRVFLERLRTLLSLGDQGIRGLRRLLETDGHAELPAGCSVDLEVEAKDLLSRLFRVNGADEVERAYREIRAASGRRPTAGELLRMDYLPSRLRERHQSWLGFVSSEGDLDEPQRRAWDRHGAFLSELETTNMTRSFRMVTLQVLLEHDALVAGMPAVDVARRAHAITRRSPELFEDIASSHRFAQLDETNERKWQTYWRNNPIQAWTSGGVKDRAWFRLQEERFVLDVTVAPEDQQPLAELVREIVDYRLAQYRRRSERSMEPTEGFVCRVTWNKRDPILKLPAQRAAVPEGETDVRLADGSVWVFRFAKEFCNVARPAGSTTNQLPDLLRSWFGPSAGQPGTAFHVAFRASPDGIWAGPERGMAPAIELPRRTVVAYPDLRAAAGHAASGHDPLDAAHVALPLDRIDPEHFAVRVAGTSMDGGPAPLHDGDWAVFRLARSTPGPAVEGRVALVQTPAETGGHTFQIKRVVRRPDGWWLRSDNPQGPQIKATEDSVVVARLDRAFRPEELGPEAGAILEERELAPRFGLERLDPRSGRQHGHLFVFIDREGMLPTTSQVRYSILRQPGETAFVLARRGDNGWRHLGVGRPDDEDLWRIPEVDHETWITWGAQGGVSRALPNGLLARAEQAVAALVDLPSADRTITQADGRTARVTGVAPRGGLRIDSPEGAFGERTISLIDLGWAIAASDDRDRHGGLLDEERVNRLRYLEGTPKGSTRWIDTDWAIAAWERARPLVPVSTGVTQIYRDDGTPIDASFIVEQRAGHMYVIVESRGGTKGTKDERNTEYAEGLDLLLSRLKRLDNRILDALVDSTSTRELPPEQRRLILNGEPYPLTIDDASDLRRRLTRAAARVGREPGAKGAGNQTKRLRLILEGAAMAPDEAAHQLAGGASRPLERPGEH